MKEDYFNIEKWENWLDHIKYEWDNVSVGKSIAFNISGFNEKIILLTKEANHVNFSIEENLNRVTSDDADILFEIKPIDLDFVLNDFTLHNFEKLLRSCRAMMFFLVSPKVLCDDGFHNFLEDIGFEISSSDVVPILV